MEVRKLFAYEDEKVKGETPLLLKLTKDDVKQLKYVQDTMRITLKGWNLFTMNLITNIIDEVEKDEVVLS
jgi:hypothetical protein